jgi:hypothetical protein
LTVVLASGATTLAGRVPIDATVEEARAALALDRGV